MLTQISVCFWRHCFTPPYNSRSKRFNILLWNHENPPLVCIWIIAFLKTTSVPLWQWLLNRQREQGVRYLFLEGCDWPDNLAESYLPGDCLRPPINTKAGGLVGRGGLGGPWGYKEANDCSFSCRKTKFGVKASICQQRRKGRLRTL